MKILYLIDWQLLLEHIEERLHYLGLNILYGSHYERRFLEEEEDELLHRRDCIQEGKYEEAIKDYDIEPYIPSMALFVLYHVPPL